MRSQFSAWPSPRRPTWISAASPPAAATFPGLSSGQATRPLPQDHALARSLLAPTQAPFRSPLPETRPGLPGSLGQQAAGTGSGPAPLGTRVGLLSSTCPHVGAQGVTYTGVTTLSLHLSFLVCGEWG